MMTPLTLCVRWRVALAGALLLLAGCSVLDKPVRAVVYDFGPGPRETTVSAPADHSPVRLAGIDAPSALDSTAMLYRLAYSNAQQVLPYAQARWSMPPAQLLGQRLRAGLESPTQHQPVRGARTGAGPLRELRIELLEFSQLFDAPARSVGLLRLHASVVGPTTVGEQLIARREFVVQRPAPSPDAEGGAKALSDAADAVQEELREWLKTLR